MLKKYSLRGNISFILQKAWQMDKLLLAVAVLQIPVMVLLPLCTTYLSSFLVKWISAGATPGRLAGNILGLSFALLILSLLARVTEAKIHWGSFDNRFRYVMLCSDKAMDMDYENLENPEGQTMLQRAFNSLYSVSGGTQQVFSQLVNMLSNVSGLAAYSVILAGFSPWLVVLLAGLTLAAHFVSKANNAWIHRHKDDWTPLDREIEYVRNQAGEFSAARTFVCTEWQDG